ncbi:mRNA-decapping enzyme-like protein [Cardamine amara subsp. amara]|uniref:mRNA-decapping enzyme-like protein n=1 Tax=Cardamine amara subsp. amara TaxID=228776 RepID=A0ABD1ASQ2_CARAN
MSQNGKLIPNLDQNSTRLLNLTVLQRIDPYIEEILITAAHVTFYEFNIELSQWSRKDVEGSLFVVKRSTQPRFQFIVMNRRNTDNLVENLLGDFEYEVQGPYLLYRNASQEVNGIWFYNKRECEEVAIIFNRILSAYSKVNQKPKTTSSKSEFEELEAVPTMAVMDGPLEPSSTARDAPDDPAFVNFFSSAMALGNNASGSASGPLYQSSVIPLQPHQPHQSHQPHQPTVAPPAVAAAPPQIQSPPTLPSSSPLMHLFDSNADLISSNSNVHTDLVTPDFFGPPRMMAQPHLIPISSMPTAPPLNPNNATHQQRPYGTPVLQPFPPPTPPPSLAPAPTGPVINRDTVKAALLALVQENEFIDMVTRALQNAHQP